MKVNVKYFGSTDPFLSYNSSHKNDNQMELHLLQTFRNDQNLNKNKNNTKSYLKNNSQKTFSIRTARKYVLPGKKRVSSKY